MRSKLFTNIPKKSSRSPAEDAEIVYHGVTENICIPVFDPEIWQQHCEKYDLKKLTFFNLEIIYEKTVIKHIWDL
jgi:hypothetical protein